MLTVARLTVDTPATCSSPPSPSLSLSLYRSQVPMAEAEISQEKPRSDSNLKFFMGQTTGVLLALKLPVLEEGVASRRRGGEGTATCQVEGALI